MIWVIDASVAIRWFLQQEVDAATEAVLTRVVDEPGRFAVPELFGFEVFSVLERLHPDALNCFLKGVVPLLQSGILRQPMTNELALAADEFVRLGLTGYDACYAALARDLGGMWLTVDQRAHSLLQAQNVSWELSMGLPPGLS